MKQAFDDATMLKTYAAQRDCAAKKLRQARKDLKSAEESFRRCDSRYTDELMRQKYGRKDDSDGTPQTQK